MRAGFVAAVSLLLVVPMPAVLAADTHPFSVDDLVRLRRISDPQVSPDGSQVAFVLRETDMEADKGRKDLWLVGSGGARLPSRGSGEAPIAARRDVQAVGSTDRSPRGAGGCAVYSSPR